MTDDAIRAAIVEQVARAQPTESDKQYAALDWKAQFESPWILEDERYLRTSTEVEGSGGHIYCRSCITKKKHGKLSAHRLHVRFEDDPMKVAKNGLIHLRCFNCNFDMLVPRKKPAGRFDHEDMQKYLEEYMQKSQVQGQIAQRYQAMGHQHQSMSEQQKMLTTMYRNMMNNVQMQASPPIKISELFDSKKWPFEP